MPNCTAIMHKIRRWFWIAGRRLPRPRAAHWQIQDQRLGGHVVPITEIWGAEPSWVQEQGPWSGGKDPWSWTPFVLSQPEEYQNLFLLQNKKKHFFRCLGVGGHQFQDQDCFCYDSMVQVFPWIRTLKTAWQTEGFSNKLSVFLKRPGWKPGQPGVHRTENIPDVSIVFDSIVLCFLCRYMWWPSINFRISVLLVTVALLAEQ